MDKSQTEFEALQAKLAPLWKTIGSLSAEEQTIVVVPSLSLELPPGFHGSLLQSYEERYLFLLLLLRQPRARLIYVTSQPIQPEIIDYYLALLPGVVPSQVRARLFLRSPMDGSAAPLTSKLLRRPRLLERLRSLIVDPDRAHIVPFNTTDLERSLALELGIPVYGADPSLLHFGTKSGCRELFRDVGVPMPPGRENLRGADDVVAALSELRAEDPGLAEAIIKLNDGVGGLSNAYIDLRDLVKPGSTGERSALQARLSAMRFSEGGWDPDDFLAQMAKEGGVVETRINGEEFASPSVQLRVTPLGEIEVLSTHDQILGGSEGSAYLGATFPANAGYATLITREALKIAERLGAEGVLGRFAVDFVVVRNEGSWRPYAIELNLRKGGTTHPFLTLQFLTDGRYDSEIAQLITPNGTAKFFVASDHVDDSSLRGLTPQDLFDFAVKSGLHFDPSKQTGVVFHMMSALSEFGRVGLTAVSDSPEQARQLYETAVSTLKKDAAGSFN